MYSMSKIGVLGVGTFGMSMARMLCVHGHEVQCWSALPEEIDSLMATKRHPNLPGMIVPDEIEFTKDLETVCTGKDLLLVIIPSIYIRRTARNASKYIPDNMIVVEGAKGMEAGTHMSLGEVFEDEMNARGKKIRSVILAGPTHAEEVSIDMPVCFVAASEDKGAALFVQHEFDNELVKVYTCDDPLGVALSGMFKNIIALASGVLLGMGYGDSIRAALITRGVAEMTTLGLKMGCNRETFVGLAGVGDTIVTAMSLNSRNCRCGKLIGEGVPLEQALKQVGQTVEGVNTLPAALELADQYGLELPLTRAVDDVLNRGFDPHVVFHNLMVRESGEETAYLKLL